MYNIYMLSCSRPILRDVFILPMGREFWVAIITLGKDEKLIANWDLEIQVNHNDRWHDGKRFHWVSCVSAGDICCCVCTVVGHRGRGNAPTVTSTGWRIDRQSRAWWSSGQLQWSAFGVFSLIADMTEKGFAVSIVCQCWEQMKPIYGMCRCPKRQGLNAAAAAVKLPMTVEGYGDKTSCGMIGENIAWYFSWQHYTIPMLSGDCIPFGNPTLWVMIRLSHVFLTFNI